MNPTNTYNADEIIREVVAAMLSHLRHTLDALYFGGAAVVPHIPAGEPLASPFEQSPLAEQIRLVVRVANGEIEVGDHRKHAQQRGELSETIQSICETLLVAPCQSHYDIPAWFWMTKLGEVVIRCQNLLLGQDEIISLSEAARILYGATDSAALNKIDRLIARGDLQAWADPDEPNPRRSRRVRRTSVHQLAVQLKQGGK